MKIFVAAGYLTLFRDFKPARLIKTQICKLSTSFKDQRALRVLHGIISVQC